MKTRKFRKSMLSTLVILMAAVLSLTGATYAWFTTGDSATVSNISAGVESGTGLLISTDASNWSSVADIKISESSTFVYKTLSSAGNVTNGELDIFTAALNTANQKINGIAAADKTATGAGEASRNGGYVAFDIYFNNANGPAKNISIGNIDITSTSANTRAFRIAFIKQGEAAVNSMGDDYTSTLKALKLTSGTATIYEPMATSHITNGVKDYQTNYNSAAAGDSKFEYYGIKAAPESLLTDVERYVGKYTDGAYVAGTSDYLAKVETKTDTADTYFTLSENSYTKITVVIWLEGQDADCLNEISGGSFAVTLGFTASAVAAQ